MRYFFNEDLAVEARLGAGTDFISYPSELTTEYEILTAYNG